MKKTKRSILIFVMVFALIFQSITPIFAAVLNLEIIVDRTSAKTDQTITYTIKYANPDTQNNLSADQATIVATLPDKLEYVGNDASADYPNVNVSGNVVTFTTNGDLAAGKTGFVKLKAKFKQGTTFNGDTAILSANGTNAPVVTAIVDASQLTISKVKSLPTVNPALDSNVTYGITVNAMNTGLNVDNVVVVDTLPVGTSYISSSDGGVYDLNTNQITWNLGTINAGAQRNLSVIVQYSDVNFDVGNTPSNQVTVTGTDLALISLTASASVQITLAAANPVMNGINKSSRQGNDQYAIGQDLKFYLSGFGNGGNVPLDNMTIIDTIPNEMDLKSVTTGNYSNATGVTVNVLYQLNGEAADTWHDLALAVGASANQTLNIPDLGGNYITKVKWELGTVPASFSVSTPIQLSGTLISPKHGGGVVNTGDTVTNLVDLTSSCSGNPLAPSSDTEIVTVASPKPWLVVTKTTAATAYELDTLTYTIKITNHSFATGDLDLSGLNTLYITDAIPAFLENFSFDSASLSGNNPQVLGSISAYDVGNCRWVLSGTVLKPGQYVQIQFTARIKDPTTVGTYSNTVSLTANNFTLDNRSTTSSTANTFVKFTGSLGSEKLVKGELDVDFTKYPQSSTLAGGPAKYRLTVSNANSNGPIANIVIIDKLPKVGDIGVVDTSVRGSEWRPYLVNNGVIPTITGLNGAVLDNNITVYYSTIDNPDLGQLSDPENEAGYNSGWSTTAPADITTVTALKFDFGNITLNPAQSVVLEWDMRAPVGTPVSTPGNDEYIAWNSFGYGATYTDVGGQEPFLPSEPIKVGIKVATQVNSSLGDYIWEDKDMDGIQEAGETGVNGIIVNLYLDHDGNGTPDGAVIDYTMTGNDYNGNPGYYLFPNLAEDKYIVEYKMPNTYYVTLNNQGADDAIDSDFAQFNGSSFYRTSTITLGANAADLTIDAGIYKKASIGDYVWYDKDKDGYQDNGESGIAGVTVSLYIKNGENWNQLGPSILTNGSGYYLFQELDPAAYKVKVDVPEAYAISTKDNNADNQKDSDIEESGITVGYTAETNLISGENDLTWDAGLYLGMIGDLIWEDKDADGVKEAGESGISGVSVKLYDTGTGLQVGTTKTTDANGLYSFADLPKGNYRVEITRPVAYNCFTLSNQGGNDSVDSDAAFGDKTDATANISNIDLDAGEWDMTNDAGLYKYASLGDKVFNDYDHDGKQDASELGISGVTVNLYYTSDINNIFRTTTTDANGLYSFTQLIPGDYTVKFITPNGYAPTTADASGTGITDSNDSDANIATGFSGSYNLISGENDTTVDAGYHKARLGNYVWEDMNYNGTQDEAVSKGINGVTVNLYKTSAPGVVFATTTTANDASSNPGYYIFENLEADNYFVEFAPVAGYYPTYMNSAGDSLDSDMNTATLKTDTYNLALGDNNLTVDAGFYRYAKVGDYVWVDKDYNGIQDAGELPVSGVTVQLLNPDDNDAVLATDTTNEDGFYLFDQLVPDSYKIKFLLPENYNGFTQTGKGTTDTDSNATQGNGLTGSFTLVSNEDNRTYDTGVYKYAKLGNFIFLDENVDGLHSEGETGVSGVTVNLIDSTKLPEDQGYIISTTTTSFDGHYWFENLIPGTYKVKVIEPVGYKITLQDVLNNVADSGDSDFSPSTGFSGKVTGSADGTVTLVSGETNDTIDGGIYNACSLGDTIWKDLNANGIQELGEIGIPNITIKLYDNTDHLLSTQTTDANGKYLFDDLTVGQYYIQIVVPDSWFVSPVHIEIESTDSDIDAGSLKSDVVSLTQDMDYLHLDGGLYQKASLGDYVWLDLDGDGIQDNGEAPISNVVVTLTYPNETTTNVTTDANGYYIFTNLVPGIYDVHFTTPNLFVKTDSNKGADDEKDSDLDINGDVNNLTLISGQNRTDIDAGYNQLGSIGDYIFVDQDNDGIQDENEKGIKDIKLTLIDAANNKVTTKTDQDGKYIFDELKPGTYVAQLELPVDYYLTYDNRGEDDAKDSDFNTSTLKTGDIILSSNQDIITVDGGVYYSPKPLLAELGDYVWVDEDRDGVQDSTEKGLSGVTINLYDGTGGFVKTITTDYQGYYIFKELSSGTYTVTVDKSTIKDYVQTYDLDKTLDDKSTTTLIAGAKMLELDFGYVLSKPAIAIDKSADKESTVKGGIVKYAITVSNTGNIPLTQVLVIDDMLKLKETITSIAVGESKTFTVSYTVTDSDEEKGSVLNIATADSNETEKVSDSVKVVVKIIEFVEEEEDKTKPPTHDGPSTGEQIFTPSEEVKDIIILVPPTNGEVIITEDHQIIFIPGDNYDGEDHMTIKIITPDGDEIIQEIDIFDDITPLGGFPILDDVIKEITALPKTGEKNPLGRYAFAALFIGLGIHLRKKR